MPELRKFRAGQLIRFSATFVMTDTGTPIEPGEVEFSYRVGDGDPVFYYYGTDAEVLQTSPGSFEISIDSTGKVGTWAYIWASTGLGQAIVSRAVIVQAPAIDPVFP